MAITYKLKAPTVQAIEVTSPIAQAYDIANLIGASAFIVDIMANTATFTVMDGGETISVTAGKVISITSGVISIQDSVEFYAMYEADISG